MITLANVKDWLKIIYPSAEHYYCGKLDNKKEKSIGVYQRRPSGVYRIPMGGMENKSYEEKEVSILLHWTKYSDETEKEAFLLFETIRDAVDTGGIAAYLTDEGDLILLDENGEQLLDAGQTGTIIGNHRVLYIRMEVQEPIDVGTDDNGVYERVIWIRIYYDRQEQEG